MVTFKNNISLLHFSILFTVSFTSSFCPHFLFIPSFLCKSSQYASSSGNFTRCLRCPVALVYVTENEVFKSFYFWWMSESLLWGWNGSTGICPHEWGMWQKENSANCVLLLIFGIVLLIVWHDIKEGTVQTDDDYCSTSLIHLSRTYLIRFCGSQTGVGISAEWTLITISVIMPILRSPARNPAQTCWEYKLWLLTY